LVPLVPADIIAAAGIWVALRSGRRRWVATRRIATAWARVDRVGRCDRRWARKGRRGRRGPAAPGLDPLNKHDALLRLRVPNRVLPGARLNLVIFPEGVSRKSPGYTAGAPIGANSIADPEPETLIQSRKGRS
jgi:hypothetical protein